MRKSYGYKMLFTLVCLLLVLAGCSLNKGERKATLNDAKILRVYLRKNLPLAGFFIAFV